MKSTLLAILVLISLNVMGQDSICVNADPADSLVVYTPEFKFKRGIYLTYEDFKNNSPLPLSAVKTDLDSNSVHFFKDLLSHKKIYIYDNGQLRLLKNTEYWGYSDGRRVYCNSYGRFSRLDIIGSICFFVKISPMLDLNDAFYSHAYTNITRKNMMDPGRKTQADKYIMNFENGEVFLLNKKQLVSLLSKDAELLNDYNKYKGKKDVKTFMFIMKYNQKHPISFLK
ncbi:hypothetical protein [Sporocytophaga myxococcoides]|uniref:hypothetical protein n=1 Tax=Sporocytophaga myxococcoides TaxID=153721 RepID=UPI0012DEB1F2|nr:hypothetical protein [Sporocytophaga myxococcoides]